MSSTGGESSSERRARRRLEPFLGPLSRLDRPGADGACDYMVESGPHSGAVLEVTEVTSALRPAQRSSLRRQPEWRIDSRLTWVVWLYPRARVASVGRSPELVDLLQVSEREGVLALPYAGMDPAARKLLRDLGIEGIQAFPASPGREGVVRMSSGGVAGSAYSGPDIDLWLADQFAAELIRGKVAELDRSGASERHLYVGADQDTPAGLGISLAIDSATWAGAAPIELPTFAPPREISSLWVWPDAPGGGLLFRRASGWEMVEETADAHDQIWGSS